MPYKVEIQDDEYFAITVEPGTPNELRVYGHLTDEKVLLCPAKLGNYLKHLRKQLDNDKTGKGKTSKGKSIKAVCAKIELSTGYYWRIEAGALKQAPRMVTIKKLADYFKVGSDSLIALSGARSLAELNADQEERSQDSMEVVFTRMVLHEQLKPAGLSADDLGWVPEKLQHAWVDFAKRLAHTLTDNPDALDELLSGGGS